jgi:RIO-like serine/threonine protein kinase
VTEHDPRAIDRTNRPDRIVYSMRALGKSGLPETFTISGITYRLYRTIKHDFVAATGFYRDDAGRMVVLKMGRTQEFAGFPLQWLGQWLCRREARFYRKLADTANIPQVVGFVGQTGFVHEYVEGQPLSKERPVPDGFFLQLQELLHELHRRNIAYVDTNKPENILQGDDGRPHLIDFQISLDLETVGNWPLGRWLLKRFQDEDLYHILKHKRRLRKDELTPQDVQAPARHRAAPARRQQLKRAKKNRRLVKQNPPAAFQPHARSPE